MTEIEATHNYAYAICNTCGRFAEDSKDGSTPEQVTAALVDFAEGHTGVQMFGEEPSGWPRHVSGVHVNGHLLVTFGGLECCATCGVGWPCDFYAAEAANCSQSLVEAVPYPPPSPEPV